MARVTVEDCVDKVENRFELILVASHRARMISSGSKITVERDNDKNPVVALREIAAARLHVEDGGLEVDDAEPGEPLIGISNATVDSGDTAVTSEHMTEEDLLKGIEGLALVPREEPEEDLREEDANLR